MRHSYIGYNYSVLSEWLGDCANGRGRSLAAVSQPAGTIAYTDSVYGTGVAGSWNPSSNPNGGRTDVGFSEVNGPAEYALYVPAANTCVWYNGLLGGWDWAVAPTNPKPDFTGFVSLRHFDGTNIGYVDGHVKYAKWRYLTEGTNVAPGVADTAVKVLDVTKYHWDPDWTGDPNGH